MSDLSGVLRQYRGEMSSEEIIHATECISRNARELLEDAKLLFDHKRYARATSLAILAIEESSKSASLLNYYQIQSEPESRKKFWSEYRSHPKKIERKFLALSLSGAINEEMSEEEAKRRAAGINLHKQSGLYADCYEHGGSGLWMAPSELLSKSQAEVTLKFASDSVGNKETIISR